MSNEWSEADDVARIPLQLARSCVVASIQIDLTLPVLRRFRADLLEFLRETGARAVILDLSGLMIMDIDEFDAVRETMAMVRLMGAESVIAGMQPGVISSLIDLDAEVDGISAAFNLDGAFDLVENLVEMSMRVQEE